jgi:hypothetical protein
MGSDCVPWLIKWARSEKPGWVHTVRRAISSVLPWRRPVVVGTFKASDAEMRARGAMYALILLGPKAVGARDELGKMLLETNNSHSTRFAPMALAAIGEKGLPPLVAALTNDQTTSFVKCCVAGNLAQMGTNARACVPAMQQALGASNWMVRCYASNVIRKIAPQTLESRAER